MAVPTGEYEVRTSADLSPLFGVVEGRKRLRIEQPGPDALERLIDRLDSLDSPDRPSLVDELALFTDDGERVAPLLLEIVGREDDSARFSAIYGLREFPEHVEETKGVLLPLLDTTEPIGGAAALVLGALYPNLNPLTQAYGNARDRGQMDLVGRIARAIQRFFADEEAR